MSYIKPKKLVRGDTVAVLSPSWGGPHAYPYVYENGLKVLNEWGLRIKEFPTTRASANFLQHNPQARAEDINNAFADKNVKAIFSSIGGTDSIQVLPFLNKKTIVENPKIFWGFSDTSTVHTYCNILGLTTFYGPSIMAGFSQMESLPASFKEHVHDMLFAPTVALEYRPYSEYCNGYPDWGAKENSGKVNELKKNTGWKWLQGSTVVQGELFGGCMPVLEKMKDTEYWPMINFWKNKIFFLEISENKPSLQHVEEILRDYWKSGVFDSIRGFLFARARGFTDDEKLMLENSLHTIVAEECGRSDLPIITNFDIGHTDPQLVMPLGITAQIDCRQKRVSLIEPWLQP